MKLNIYIIRLLSILQLFLLFAYVMHFEGIISITSQLVLICGVLLIIDSLVFRPKFDFIIIVIYLFVLCIGSYSYELMIRSICFLMMVSTFDIGCSTIKIDKNTYNMLSVSYVLQAFLLIIVSTTPMAYSYDVEGEYGHFLSLGFSNPNTTGVVLFSTILTLIALFESSFDKSFSLFKKSPVLLYIVILFLLRALYLTDSRSSIIVCFVSILLFLYFKFRSITKPFSKLTIIIITLIPTIYSFVYMFVFSKGYFAETEFLGKPLMSGRENVFQEVNALWTNFWFGNIEKLQFANSHNVSLTLLANIGFLGFVLVIFYYFTRLLFYNKKGRNSIAFLALIALFFHGSNEAVMFTGGSIFYIYVLNLCLLAGNSSMPQINKI